MTGEAWNVLGVFVAIGLPVAGAVFGVLKTSIGRHIKNMDERFAEVREDIADIKAKVDTLFQRYEGLKGEAMSRPDCERCRQNCQQGMVQWMQRIEDKIDKQNDKIDKQNERVVTMLANMNNGLGGVRENLPVGP